MDGARRRGTGGRGSPGYRVARRRCYLCGRRFPATTDFFYPERKGGVIRWLERRCKTCSSARGNAYRKARYVPHPRKTLCGTCGRRFSGPYIKYRNRCQACRDEKIAMRPFRKKARYLRGTMSVRAKAKGIKMTISNQLLFDLLRKTTACPCCGSDLNFDHHGTGFHARSPSIDRLDPLKGYVPENIAVICTRCNILKRDATADELVCVARWMRRQARSGRSRSAP